MPRSPHQVRQSICEQIADGHMFREIASRLGVTFAVVEKMAFEPETYHVCAKCIGAGQVADDRRNVATRCDACNGWGFQ